ncbi:exonuclease SbcCD subunit D [Capnocytophaga sp. ARDL2]|uniref:metallophosphoesterase family protein n=1 Tax=Capnocytophaga sp. ARDL2 TaxID=3238809 RepID=UPI003555EB8F
MKLLHTADWHLGKRLDRFSRIEEQKAVLNEIICIANRESVDMVVVAGDLFDSFNPPAEAIELFFETLIQLSDHGNRPVIAIAGNHDAPAFINAPNALAKINGIILTGFPLDRIAPYKAKGFEILQSDKGFVELKINSIDFPVRVALTPFANEWRLKSYMGEDREQALNDALKNHWQKIATNYCDNQGVNLLVTHLYMNKRNTPLLDEPDGEKPLKIGTADLIYTDAIPTEFQYVALGHLHNFNDIGTENCPIVYASSPLCYSFSEAGQQKAVAIVELFPNKKTVVNRLPLSSGYQLHRPTFNDIENAVQFLENHKNTYVELTFCSDEFIKNEDKKRLFAAHDKIVYLIPQIVKKGKKNNQEHHNINLNKSEWELFVDYFKLKNNNQEPNEDIKNLFKEITQP